MAAPPAASLRQRTLPVSTGFYRSFYRFLSSLLNSPLDVAALRQEVIQHCEAGRGFQVTEAHDEEEPEDVEGAAGGARRRREEAGRDAFIPGDRPLLTGHRSSSSPLTWRRRKMMKKEEVFQNKVKTTFKKERHKMEVQLVCMLFK